MFEVNKLFIFALYTNSTNLSHETSKEIECYPLYFLIMHVQFVALVNIHMYKYVQVNKFLALPYLDLPLCLKTAKQAAVFHRSYESNLV